MRVSVRVGDICNQQVDAVVVSAVAGRRRLGGSFAADVFSAAGQDTVAQWKALRFPAGFPRGHVEHVGGGALPCKYILAVALPADSSGLPQAVFDCLVRADELRCRSVAVPSLGAGGWEFSRDESCRGIIAGIVRFQSAYGQKSTTSVREVRLVVFQLPHLPLFLRHARASVLDVIKPGTEVDDVTVLHTALYDGTKVAIPCSRTVVVGESGVGKSSLCNSLTGEEMPVDGDSTEGLELSTVTCLTNDAGPWSRERPKDTKDRMVQLMVQMSRSLSDGGDSHDSSTSSGSEDHDGLTGGGAEGKEKTRQDECKSLHQDMEFLGPRLQTRVHYIAANVVSAEYIRSVQQRIASGSYRIVSLWDLAGQEVYRSMQFVFLGQANTTYVIVFDASRPLLAEVPGAAMRRAGISRPLASALPTQSNLLHIHDWLDVFQRMPGSQPCSVCVVGCKKDQRAGGEAELDKDRRQLMASLRGTPYEKMVMDVIFVDNTVSGTGEKEDAGVLRLRQLLSRDDEAANEQVELSWLLCSLALQELSNTLETPWITAEEARYLALSVCGSDVLKSGSFEELCSYQMSLGRMLYFPECQRLSDRVVVNIEAVLSIISALMRPGILKTDYPFGDQPDANDLTLYRKGIVTADLIAFLWRRHSGEFAALLSHADHRCFFLSLMQELSILCDIGEVEISGSTATSHCSSTTGTTSNSSSNTTTTTSTTSTIDTSSSIATSSGSSDSGSTSASSNKSGGAVMSTAPSSASSTTSPGSTSLRQLYLMPAVADARDSVETSGKLSPSILLCCEQDQHHFPQSLLLQVAVKCIARHNDKTTSCWPLTGVQLSKMAVRLPWDTTSGLWLVLRYMKLGISLQMEKTSRRPVDMKSGGPGVGCEALQFVKDSLHSVQSVSQQAMVCVQAVACDCATAAGARCTLHGSESCHGDECFHNVVDLRVAGQPRCPVSGREQSVAETVEFWNNWTQNDNFVLEQRLQVGGSEEAAADDETRRCHDAIRRHFSLLARRVRGRELARLMWQEKLLTDRAVEEISAAEVRCGRTAANEFFLQELLMCDGDVIGHLVDVIMPECGRLQHDVRATLKTCPGESCHVRPTTAH